MSDFFGWLLIFCGVVSIGFGIAVYLFLYHTPITDEEIMEAKQRLLGNPNA